MLNQSIIMGRLTHDPELRTTPNGVSVVRFQVALDRPKQRNAEPKTDYIDVEAWRSQADFVSRYFQKGQMIAVVGPLHKDSYTDKNGVKRERTYISADTVSFCGDKPTNNNYQAMPQGVSPMGMGQMPPSQVGTADMGQFSVIQDALPVEGPFGEGTLAPDFSSDDDGLPF